MGRSGDSGGGSTRVPSCLVRAVLGAEPPCPSPTASPEDVSCKHPTHNTLLLPPDMSPAVHQRVPTSPLQVHSLGSNTDGMTGALHRAAHGKLINCPQQRCNTKCGDAAALMSHLLLELIKAHCKLSLGGRFTPHPVWIQTAMRGSPARSRAACVCCQHELLGCTHCLCKVCPNPRFPAGA